MGVAILAARLLLTVTFAVAGGAKLIDQAGARRALTGFGVPSAAVGPLAWLLPLGEIAVAVALVPATSAWVGAVGALVFLVLFVTGVGLNLALGRRPDCHCFGQLHSEPIGWSTIARNGALACVAGLLIWQGPENVGPDVLAWLGDAAGSLGTGAGGLLAWGLLIGEAVVLVQLMRQNGRLLLRIAALEERFEGSPPPAATPATPPSVFGLPVGMPAPAFSLPDVSGHPISLDDLRAFGKPVLLAFLDPDCGPCTALVPEFGRWRRERAGRFTLAVLSRGTVEANRRKFIDQGIAPVLLQQAQEVSQAYRVPGTPSLVLVLPDGTVGSPVAAGADAIHALVSQIAGGQPVLLPMARPTPNGHAHDSRPASLSIGVPAPTIELPDLDGRMVRLADLRGRTTLLLFWNPGCGFCQRMLPDLQAWEAEPTMGRPSLLVVSNGAVEANRRQGFRAPVVLDQNFAIGQAFRVSGTPSAMLVDADGRIGSELAMGAESVLALARTPVGVA